MGHNCISNGEDNGSDSKKATKKKVATKKTTETKLNITTLHGKDRCTPYVSFRSSDISNSIAEKNLRKELERAKHDLKILKVVFNKAPITRCTQPKFAFVTL